VGLVGGKFFWQTTLPVEGLTVSFFLSLFFLLFSPFEHSP